MLSFLFMGLGQAYNGEMAKAVVFLVLYALSIFLTVFLIGFITTPILWIWSMVDAYRSSQKMNQVGSCKVLAVECFTFGFGDECSCKGLGERSELRLPLRGGKAFFRLVYQELWPDMA